MFSITGWERAVYECGGNLYVSICSATDSGGNDCVIYRTAYHCAINSTKSPPRPPHQVAMRSRDAKNPDCLGAPAFRRLGSPAFRRLADGPVERALPCSQSASADAAAWASAEEGMVFCSLFWHNPQSYGAGDVAIAAAGGGKGCLYDLVKTSAQSFDLKLVFYGDQNAGSVPARLTKSGWWVPTSPPAMHVLSSGIASVAVPAAMIALAAAWWLRRAGGLSNR